VDLLLLLSIALVAFWIVRTRQDASTKDRAFAILAVMLLMRHTCHWDCRSKSVPSARIPTSHRTSYEQLVEAVLPRTRQE